MMEWRAIPGYEGSYEVSSDGQVRFLGGTIPRRNKGPITYAPRLRNPYINGSGYWQVGLCKQGVKTNLLVHRLVALAFLPPVAGKPDVNHKDGNKLNACVDNLEWCTPSENATHRYRVLGHPNPNQGKVMASRRPVVATLPDGSVRRYPCISASAADGYNPSAVSAVLKGHQATHGSARWADAEAA